MAAPFCSGKRKCIHTGISATHPHLLLEWAYDLNIQDPCYVAPSSNILIW
jgi:hypothetical protein